MSIWKIQFAISKKREKGKKNPNLEMYRYDDYVATA